VIIKSFELNKINLSKQKIFLFYGENDGLKQEVIEKKFLNNFNDNVFKYSENEIIKNIDILIDHIKTKSFFYNNKLLIINNISEKFYKILSEINKLNLSDVNIILISGPIEKKSKIRQLFEKDKNFICVPFYEDNSQTIRTILSEFLYKNKISLSQEIINMIIEKSKNDRLYIKNELLKIQAFKSNKSKINNDEIVKLINNFKNYQIDEMVDNYLNKNRKKIEFFLNEDILSLEDNIKIIKTILYKLKRLKKLLLLKNKNDSIEIAISSYKPQIFWKDKEILKTQLKIWSINDVKMLIKKVFDLELLIKKNSEISNVILNNFILEKPNNYF